MDYTDLNFIFGLLRIAVLVMAIPSMVYALYLLRRLLINKRHLVSSKETRCFVLHPLKTGYLNNERRLQEALELGGIRCYFYSSVITMQKR